MITTKHKHALLVVAIFGFAFLFRAAVVFHNPYPPSSDIGLHGSILNLILDEGTLPEWNPYHMGGEPLATPVGFHFFVSVLIMFTGMPIVLAEIVTAAFFSSFVVFPAYLVSKQLWKNSNAGLLASLFAGISALSLEMIGWGGYTNVVSLALMILLFYLFIRDLDHPRYLNLVMGSMLFGTLVLTHTFSLSVILPVLVLFFIFLAIAKIRKLENIQIKQSLKFFVVCGVFGALLIAPWVFRVLNFYVSASSEGALLGGLETNKNLILENRTLSFIIVGLLIALVPTFYMLKGTRKKYVDTHSLLLVAWFVVPIVMTQAHLFGIYVDYSRFMYFIDFPGIMIISAALLYLLRYTKAGSEKYAKMKWIKTRKYGLQTVFTTFVLLFIILSPWSILPKDAMDRADYYTTMHGPEGVGLEFIQTKTPEGSVLVGDHLYGWWLSGIGKRPTLSAAGLEFLIYPHEMEVAQSAQFMLDTNYFVDNGLIQIRENAPHLWRHNPGISYKSWSGKSYSMMYFLDNQTSIGYNYLDEHGNQVDENILLTEIRNIDATMTYDNDSTTITVSRENSLLKVQRIITIYKGVRFMELSYVIEPKDAQTNIIEAQVTLNRTSGIPFTSEDNQIAGVYDPNPEVIGEVICQESIPTKIVNENDLWQIALQYSFSENHTTNIKLLVGVYSVEGLSSEEIEQMYYDLAENPYEIVNTEPIYNWSYVEMIEEYDVSYVVCRYPIVYPKFAEDPRFRTVFMGRNVAVFQVVK
ncbi:MAG: hypothetical protein NWF03_02380 [Candidatus Bathyarchaeota archaeon]|nr:hypothetical protein [Candidatus Bathyarchaeota archaeon]